MLFFENFCPLHNLVEIRNDLSDFLLEYLRIIFLRSGTELKYRGEFRFLVEEFGKLKLFIKSVD